MVVNDPHPLRTTPDTKVLPFSSVMWSIGVGGNGRGNQDGFSLPLSLLHYN